ncbi:MAG: archaellin/type IV pilin N-terminal domain-containing protein [Candidatus Syntropharchaeia archaeon]
MKANKRSIRKDDRAFTGLEAAIVLTAFVVVAAVFSYVVLNAGFFTTQKSKEVIHTGVEQATSSVELAGDIIGHGWLYDEVVINSTNATIYNGTWNRSTYTDTANFTTYNSYYAWNNTTYPHKLDSTNLTVVEFYLQLTAGEEPLSLKPEKLTIAYSDKGIHVGNLTYNSSENATEGNMTMGCWNYSIVRGDSDTLLEKGEQAKIIVSLPEYGVTANKEFTIEIKPATGATLAITRKAPNSIHKTDILV